MAADDPVPGSSNRRKRADQGGVAPSLLGGEMLVKAVQTLLAAGADCNSADSTGMTPLMHAAANPQAARPVLDLLLESGASTRAMDNQRRSPLTHAVRAQCLVVTPRMTHMVDLDEVMVFRSLPASSLTLSWLLSSINTRFPALEGRTQLHITVRRGDVRALELLLASGADPNAQDALGNTPLMYWPVAPPQPEDLAEQLVTTLLAHAANPNIPNLDSRQALDLACQLSKFDQVLVRPQSVPVHAVLVGFGAKHSQAFLDQHRPALQCLKANSSNSFRRLGKTFGSLKVVTPTDQTFAAGSAAGQ
eukprot:gene5366-5601_t